MMHVRMSRETFEDSRVQLMVSSMLLSAIRFGCTFVAIIQMYVTQDPTSKLLEITPRRHSAIDNNYCTAKKLDQNTKLQVSFWIIHMAPLNNK